MKLKKETALERYERLSPIFRFHYERTSGKILEGIKYESGYVTVNDTKVRLNKLEEMINTLKKRPSFYENH